MDVEGKLQLKDVDADDFGAMRSQFVVMKRIVDELYATSEMAMSRSQLNHLFGEYYDVGTIVDAYEIFGGYVNRSFGAIVEKDGVRKDYFIRKYKRDATDADIKVEHNLIEYAIAHGMKDAAGVIRTKDGESFVKMVEEKEGQKVVRTFAVYEYLDGEDTYDWINTNMTPEEDAEFARILAKFHNFTNGFDPGEKEEARILDLVKMFKKKFPLMGNGMEIPAYNRFYRLWKEATPFFVEMCDKVTDGLTKDLTDGMPECPCHCDIHPGNVKWKDGKCVGLYDFDWSKLDYRLFDVCFALVYSCSSWEAQTDGRLWFDRCGYYLDGYNQFLKEEGTLSPFTAEEKKAFPYMMLAACLYLTNWATCYFDEWEDLNEYEYYFYLTHIVKLLHYIDNHQDDLAEVIKNV
ncbi:MAG TPA: phosphotransferase [Firmicutes bacterium]|nr:phosphotransferase [Bacillota bacterium]